MEYVWRARVLVEVHCSHGRRRPRCTSPPLQPPRPSLLYFPPALPASSPQPAPSTSPTTTSLVTPRATASVPVGTYPHHQHPQLARAASPLAQLPYRFPFPAPRSLSPSPSSPSSSPSLPPYRHVLGRRQRAVEIRDQDKNLEDRIVRK